MPAIPKPRPAALERKDRRAERVRFDLEETAKVKVRSGGRCEIQEVRENRTDTAARVVRCNRRALHTHHMMGGWGVRARGKSALAQHKQAACETCHAEITRHILKLVSAAVYPLWDDYYVRQK